MNGEDEMFETSTAPCVGERLRAAREAQGLTVEEIAATTRIPTRHLRTIERCEYDGLPAATYSVGFIKTLARRLGLDGAALAAQFRAEMSGARTESTQPQPYEPADPRRTPPLGLALLALAAAIVLGLGYLYWRGSTEQPSQIAAAASDQPTSPAPGAAPVQTAVATDASPLTNASSPTGPVVIGATQDVWIKVADGGKSLFFGLLHAGDRFEVPATAVAPLLTTGRPGSTTISVGQTPIPPVGDPDRIAKDVSLKPADLMARVATPPPAAQPPANSTTPVENAAGPL
ncbi:helix-turn-helix domain-containing protein [Sphingomonas crusticola]|uniref:helix-turn-helix domain-containing protein n=1 Tax=Sphingomonas crusticola TaxID=1697973 RepID=UPI000E26DD09|nr:helix-turn-helix domain-containing protein [Sphingomonas crusticola]